MQSEFLTVKKFYKDREIFVTGATGFIGKVLIFKLLKSCPDIKAIFLLMRPKKGVSTIDRLKKFTENEIFDEIKASNPSMLSKLQVINGDCILEGLGISDKGKRMIKDVSLIFHVAASTRFDDPLKRAILLNTRGALEVCKLAENLPKLDCLLHVSTSYIKPKWNFMDETLPTSDCIWEYYIKYAETFDESSLQILSPKLTKFAPNTYTFSKNLAEQICADYKVKKKLPIVIYRPSIVVSAEQEPFPGWADNIEGMSGLFLAVGAGIKRVALVPKKGSLNCVPVDICVNGMIVAAYKKWKDQQDSQQMSIYNCASIKIAKFKTLMENSSAALERNACLNNVWYPSVTISECRFMQYLRMLFYQWIPAILLDIVLRFNGRNPFLLKIHRKIYAADLHFAHFAQRSFYFVNKNFLNLSKVLSENERKEFYVKEQCKDLLEYVQQCYAGGRKYILRETEEQREIAKSRLRLKKYLHKTISTISYLFEFYLIYRIFMFLYKIVLDF